MSENLPNVKYEELHDLSYKEAWAYQGDILQSLVKKKRADADIVDKKPSVHRLLFCEHKPVFTLGKSGRATGPHLDIRLNWFDVKLDPVSILNLN